MGWLLRDERNMRQVDDRSYDTDISLSDDISLRGEYTRSGEHCDCGWTFDGDWEPCEEHKESE